MGLRINPQLVLSAWITSLDNMAMLPAKPTAPSTAPLKIRYPEIQPNKRIATITWGRMRFSSVLIIYHFLPLWYGPGFGSVFPLADRVALAGYLARRHRLSL